MNGTLIWQIRQLAERGWKLILNNEGHSEKTEVSLRGARYLSEDEANFYKDRVSASWRLAMTHEGKGFVLNETLAGKVNNKGYSECSLKTLVVIANEERVKQSLKNRNTN